MNRAAIWACIYQDTTRGGAMASGYPYRTGGLDKASNDIARHACVD